MAKLLSISEMTEELHEKCAINWINVYLQFLEFSSHEESIINTYNELILNKNGKK